MFKLFRMTGNTAYFAGVSIIPPPFRFLNRTLTAEECAEVFFVVNRIEAGTGRSVNYVFPVLRVFVYIVLFHNPLPNMVMFPQ